MALLHPKNGVTIVLQRQSHEPEQVCYSLGLYSATTHWSGLTTLDAARSAFDVGPFSPGQPPAWALSLAERMLKSLATKGIKEGLWPRKLSRWRAEERLGA